MVRRDIEATLKVGNMNLHGPTTLKIN